MANVTRALLVIAALASTATQAHSQTTQTFDLADVGTSPRWHAAGRTASLVDAKGTRALRLGEGPGMGVVWLDGYQFGNGTVEVDLLGRSQPVQGSFLGLAFRVLDATTHDAVYFRPFNFHAPDSTARAHACSTSRIHTGPGTSSAPSIQASTSEPWRRRRMATNGSTCV